MITITIRECKMDGWVKTSHHRTDDEHVAIRRALTKHWGSRAGWWSDSGLGRYYGQVIEPAGVGSSNCITGRCRITADRS